MQSFVAHFPVWVRAPLSSSRTLVQVRPVRVLRRDKRQPQRPGGVSRRLQTLQIGRKVRRCATIGGKTAQISKGRHRFGRADGKGLGQHPSLDLP